jgi:DNA-binding response OmpR family regulator
MAKVLLADDSVTIQKIVGFILSAEGFELKIVNTGEDALSAMSTYQPDVILADINMPGISGYQLTEQVRGNPESANTPVVLLAGAFEPIDEELALRSGVTDSLIKPFEAEDLLGKIKSVLSAGGEEEAEVMEEAEMFEEAGDAEEATVFEAEVEAEVFEAEVAEAEVFEAEVAEAEVLEELMDVEALEEALEGEVPSEGAAAVLPEIKMPSAGEISGLFRDAVDARMNELLRTTSLSEIISSSVDEKLRGLLGGVDLNAVLLEALGSGLKDSIEKTLLDVVPELADSVLKEKIGEAMGTLRSEVENIIWETVPELAESIITKEIKNIRSGR